MTFWWSPTFLAPGPVSWKTILPWTTVCGKDGWFQDDLSTFLLLLHLYLIYISKKFDEPGTVSVLNEKTEGQRG